MQLLTITGFDQGYRSMVNTDIGNQNMAAILQFQHRDKTEKPHFEPGHSATILMYTGVRFERIDFEALRDTTRHNLESPVRIAN
jgi:cytoplasmic iron level regulating protein YaaA (DUF328/UPF0246 family)